MCVNKKFKIALEFFYQIIILVHKWCTNIHNYSYLFRNVFFGKVQSKFRIHFDKNFRFKQLRGYIIQNIFY